MIRFSVRLRRMGHVRNGNLHRRATTGVLPISELRGESMFLKSLRPYRIALFLSFSLYLAACALPAVESWTTPNSYSPDDPLKGEHYTAFPGWECLLLGWMFVFGWGEVYAFGGLAWLANPLALVGVALLLFKRFTGAAVVAVASLGIGALFIIDPAGRHGYHDLPRVGAWLWLGSFLALAIAAVIRRGRSIQKPVEPSRGIG